MEKFLEPIELTDAELEAVAGGNPFSATTSGGNSSITQNLEAENFNFVGIDQGANSSVSFGNG